MILPVLASAGTNTWICVADTVLTSAAWPLNVTATSDSVVPKLVPVITTASATIPDAGLKLVMVGGSTNGAVGNTVKSVAEVAVSPLIVTVILPVAAFA